MIGVVHGAPDRTSVVIVGWQVRELLRGCLASIAAHEDRDALEVWVVDNGSTDGTAAMVAAAFPWVRLVARDDNPGFAAGNNIALPRATGDVCILLNPDTELHDASLTALAMYLRANPAVGVVGPRLLNPDGSLQSAGFAPPSLFQVWYDLVPWPRRFYHSRLNGRYPAAPLDQPYAVGFPLGACLAVRLDVLDRVGLLDEAYGMYMEELDFCARVRAAGYAVQILPTVAITHHGGQSTRQAPEAMFLALHRARRHFYRHYYPAWWNIGVRWLAETGLIVASARSFFAFRRGEHAWETCRAAVRAYGAAWRFWRQGASGDQRSAPMTCASRE
ncbi:MAG: glycosyltransferase family 2 protein [Chloroflexota bacterium]|nr:glycosyltransferase family 2 protein [Chloroflexota bacterium]